MLVEFAIPDVPVPTNPFVGYWGKHGLFGHFSTADVVATLSSTYVRCVFSALEDYRSGAEHLRNLLGKREGQGSIKVSEQYRSISRFESCITNMHLAVRSFRVLRKRKELTAPEAAVLNEIKPQFLSNAVSGKLQIMRNKMQHIEEELAIGAIAEDLPYMIQATGPETDVEDSDQPGQTLKTFDRLRVVGHVVLFAELAEWLAEMIVYVDKLQSLMPTKISSSEIAQQVRPSNDQTVQAHEAQE